MTKPFDTTTRDLLDGYPEPWMTYLGLVRDGPIQVIDSALPTVVAEADKVYHVGGLHPYLIHVELQARGDGTLSRRCLRYAQIDQRLAQEAPGALAGKIMEATLVLAGLRHHNDEINELRGRLQTVNITTESSYYRVAVAEGLKEGLMQGLKEGLMQGKVEEARRLILRLGPIRLGSPTERDREAIEAVGDLDRLERLSEGLLAASSWAELLAETGDERPTAP